MWKYCKYKSTFGLVLSVRGKTVVLMRGITVVVRKIEKFVGVSLYTGTNERVDERRNTKRGD